MKIEIELHGSTSATVTIDGRVLKYGYKADAGSWSYEKEGMTKEERDGSAGGIIAGFIAWEVLLKLCQHHMNDRYDTNPKTDEPWETWDIMTEEAADEMERNF